MTFIKLTTHAKERALQRYAIPEDKLLGLAERAVSEGMGYKDCPVKKTADWIKSKIRYDNGSAYLFGSYLFIFVDKGKFLLLITCLPVPNIVRVKIQEHAQNP